LISRRVVVSLSLSSAFFLAVNGCGSDATGPQGSGGGSHTAGSAGQHEAGNGGESGAAAGAGSCVPRTCEASGVVCGVLDDGCGQRITCDAGCATAGSAGAGDCTPTTCRAEHKDCGRISDGCGRELECGACDGTMCGAVEPNVCGCPPPESVFESTPRTAKTARSEGFAGTEAQYLELYDTACSSVDDCATACADRGGTDDMCAASECLDDGSGSNTCLPAPTWSNLQGIQAESEDVTGAAELVVVATPYHDRLLASAFALDVPAAAVVRGITVEVRRAGDASVSDASIRLVKGGAVSGAERSSSVPWTQDLDWVTYGGASDLWGESWSAQDLVADDFGVALSVNYEDTVGNARAYVDQVRVTIHYSIACNN
jgi:hypothetical protein